MPERVLFALSNTAALGADDLQWILLRASGSAAPRNESDRWRGVSFVRSAKAVLLRCIREKGIEADAAGLARLAALPDTFGKWKALNDSRKAIRNAETLSESWGAHQGPGMGKPLPARLMRPYRSRGGTNGSNILSYE